MQSKQSKLQLNQNEDKNKYYVAFSYLNINPLFKSKLLEYFDFDIISAWNVTKEELNNFSQSEDVTIPRSFLSQRDKIDIESCFVEATQDENVKILTIEDEKYPPLLKQIPDYPLSLYYKGNIDLINNECNLAVVGSRKASTEAKCALDSILSPLKNSNVTIVSGLAYGIDAKAHSIAIENNMKTIGVVGSGLDIIYPSANRPLYESIINGSGVIFSEYPLKTKPLPQNFPQRNRIVVGISKGTLVAEARIKSGAMISANLALDYNRELLCIPGSITNPNTEGIYHLIKNGASIVTSVDDLLNQMDWDIILSNDFKSEIELSDIQKRVLDVISIEAKSFDNILNELQSDVSELMIALTELEIKSLIIQENNKYHKIK